ncbi:MAG: Holliday junction branch migration protein RuvA [bacterium]
MIRRLRGLLLEQELTQVVVEAGGVGYGVAVSPQTSSGLPGVGEPVDLFIHTNVYDGGIDLYGFERAEDREVFLKLTGVSGIGPRLAMNILSGMEPGVLLQAVADGDLARLVRIPGVGKRTAERIVVELKDKFRDLLLLRGAAPTDDTAPDDRVSMEEVRSALLNFGYKAATVSRVIPLLDKAADDGATLQEIIREALRLLQK